MQAAVEVGPDYVRKSVISLNSLEALVRTCKFWSLMDARNCSSYHFLFPSASTCISYRKSLEGCSALGASEVLVEKAEKNMLSRKECVRTNARWAGSWRRHCVLRRRWLRWYGSSRRQAHGDGKHLSPMLVNSFVVSCRCEHRGDCAARQ